MLCSDHVKTGKDGVKHRNQQTKSNADLIEKKGELSHTYSAGYQ